MKKHNFTFFTLIALAILSFGCENNDDDLVIPIPSDQIPAAITSYTASYFPNETIIEADYDKEGSEVLLSNGIKLEFNNAYEITSIDSETEQPLPNEVIPVAILDYVNSQYPDTYVVSWELEGTTQEVELSNDITLTFDLYDNLLSTDNDDEINDVAIPSEVNSYVENYFPNDTISKAELDDDGFDVTLSNGIQLEFNINYEITSIDSENDQRLPNNVTPSAITDYVSSNFPNNYIVGWEQEGNYQKVTLNNDLDIIFDNNNQFVAIDIN